MPRTGRLILYNATESTSPPKIDVLAASRRYWPDNEQFLYQRILLASMGLSTGEQRRDRSLLLKQQLIGFFGAKLEGTRVCLSGRNICGVMSVL